MKPFGAPEAFMQAFGFQPADVRDYQDAHYAAQNTIKELPKKSQVGPKGQKILGIAASRQHRNILQDYSQGYGVQ
jgi:hypothetical protein